MSPAELLALSLVASISVAIFALGAGVALERVSRDPVFRHHAWGVALILTAVPPLLVGVALLTPAPVMEFAAPIVLAETAAPPAALMPTSPVEARWSPTLLAAPLLILALVVAIVRGVIVCGRLLRTPAPGSIHDPLRLAARSGEGAKRANVGRGSPRPDCGGGARAVADGPAPARADPARRYAARGRAGP